MEPFPNCTKCSAVLDYPNNTNYTIKVNTDRNLEKRGKQNKKLSRQGWWKIKHKNRTLLGIKERGGK